MLQKVVREQLQVVEQLMQWSQEMRPEKFMKRFASVMELPGQAQAASYWNNLHTLATAMHDNVLQRAQEAAGGTLRANEINCLALFSCGFEPSVIMVCMRYKNIGTVYNKHSELLRKLHVADLTDFV